jgi:K+-sensing histidine kinase KdpD
MTQITVTHWLLAAVIIDLAAAVLAQATAAKQRREETADRKEFGRKLDEVLSKLDVIATDMAKAKKAAQARAAVQPQAAPARDV